MADGHGADREVIEGAFEHELAGRLAAAPLFTR
jgi:hypothetical protein